MPDLVFDSAQLASNDLVFGACQQFGPDVSLFCVSGFPALLCVLSFRNAHVASFVPGFDGVLGSHAMALQLGYTQRPIVGVWVSSAQDGVGLVSGYRCGFDVGSRFLSSCSGRFSEASAVSLPSFVSFGDGVSLVSDGVDSASDGVCLRSGLDGRFESGLSGTVRWVSVFSDGSGVGLLGLRFGFEDGWSDRWLRLVSLVSTGVGVERMARSFAGFAAQLGVWPLGGFEDGWCPIPGVSQRPVVPQGPGLAYWGTDLVFVCPPLSVPSLVFGSKCVVERAGLRVLAARFYMSVHSVEAFLLPGLDPVPLFDVSLSADVGSFCWQLSASAPGSVMSQLAAVDGFPVCVRVSIDSMSWVFAVDALSCSREFGRSMTRVVGRSVTAFVSAPYWPVSARLFDVDHTAQQLALSALAGTGVGLDWGVGSGPSANGGLFDWLVPARSWSHNGTPLQAVQAIVHAAGGYVSSHRSEPILVARHPYGSRFGDLSGAPWDWYSGAADVEFSQDSVVTESVSRLDGPVLNGVYVSGVGAGVLAFVKRSGSAGDKIAQMVSDPAITDSIAARQRGLAILGGSGLKFHVSLDLPVLSGPGQPGVLDLGQLIQVNADIQQWRGRVRSVSVNAKHPVVRQTIVVERHVEPS